MICDLDILSKQFFAIIIEFNPQRIMHQSVLDYFNDFSDPCRGDDRKDIPVGVWNQMCESNSMVLVRVYPISPGGHYNFYGSTLDEALAQIKDEPELKGT